MQEWNKDTLYTGKYIIAIITYILDGEFMDTNNCIMSLNIIYPLSLHKDQNIHQSLQDLLHGILICNNIKDWKECSDFNFELIFSNGTIRQATNIEIDMIRCFEESQKCYPMNNLLCKN